MVEARDDTLHHGWMTVASEFGPLLQANSLDSFEKVMALSGGKIVRNFPGRRTVRLELKTAGGASQGVYLKRYETGYLSAGRRLLRFLRWPGAQDEALREWEMIQRVRSIGIQTATRIAVGQENSGGMVRRSFLMTAEIVGAIEGHTYAQRLRAPERGRLLLRVAEMAQRFHQAGLVHKDYYVGHVLVRPTSGEPELFLIDLQRVVQPCCFRARWVAKDLGALAYSTLKAGATRAELLRAYLAYCAKPALGAPEKRTARRVLGRVAWLRTRRPKHDGPFKPLA